MSLLVIENLQVFYGASQALFDVNLDLGEGEVVALMGRNGMGKSTTIKTLCRMIPHQSGRISFAGRDLAAMPSHKAARMGIGLVPEGRRCFRALTVNENLIAAARKGAWDAVAIFELFPVLAERRDQISASLSGGEQQMLAIGRALMTNPKLLVLDEATEGLAPLIRAEIWSALARLKRDTGLAILVVDKTLTELATIADKAVILERGATVWAGGFTQLDGAIQQRYLGL